MSDRLSAFGNPSHFTPGTHAHRPPLQRYGAGIAMVLLVHAGAIVAIKSGLDIRKLIHVDPPLVVTPLPLPPPRDKPVEHIDLRSIGFALAKPQAPALPQPPEFIIDEPPPPVDDTPRTDGPPAAAEPVVAKARIDPRHPLTQPGYPSYSQKMGEEGSVELLVFVLPDGRVGEAQVASSSGSRRLDEAAVREALRSWRFLPNTVDGVPTGSWNRIAIRFQMKR